jgi:hypothetical protein
MHHNSPKNGHAKHSARSALDPTRANKPPTSFGNAYPRDDVIAVIDDRESAEHAVRALSDAGLPESDVDLLDGPSVVEANRSLQQRRGRLQRLEVWLSSGFSDDAAYARAYALEAERGHYLLIAHAAQPEVVERVSQVLRAHGAHGMRHYEALTITDL